MNPYQKRYDQIIRHLPEQGEIIRTELAKKLLSLYWEKTGYKTQAWRRIRQLATSIMKQFKTEELEAVSEAIQIWHTIENHI